MRPARGPLTARPFAARPHRGASSSKSSSSSTSRFKCGRSNSGGGAVAAAKGRRTEAKPAAVITDGAAAPDAPAVASADAAVAELNPARSCSAPPLLRPPGREVWGRKAKMLVTSPSTPGDVHPGKNGWVWYGNVRTGLRLRRSTRRARSLGGAPRQDCRRQHRPLRVLTGSVGVAPGGPRPQGDRALEGVLLHRRPAMPASTQLSAKHAGRAG
eukprot:363678-Chlamydomonas_euryale.AAC.5